MSALISRTRLRGSSIVFARRDANASFPGLAQPPAHFGCKTLVKLSLVSALRRLSHALVEPVSVVTDQNTPALHLDAIENDLCRRGRRGRRLLAETARTIKRDLLD